MDLRKEYLNSFLLIRYSFLFLFYSLPVFADTSESSGRDTVVSSPSIFSPSIFSPPQISEDKFLIAYGRLSATNDFSSRSLESPAVVSSTCSVTNMHGRKKDAYEVDAELYVCGLQYERSLSELFRVSIFTAFHGAGGGVFDSSIRNFHNTFFFPNGPRRRDNQDRYLASGALRSGEEFLIEREDFGVRDPVVSVSVPVFSPEDSKEVFFDNIFFEAAVSVPLGLSTFSLSSPDLKFALVMEGERSYLRYASGFSFSFHTDRKQHGILYERFNYGGFFSSNIPIDETFHLLLGLMFRSNITSDVKHFDAYALYLDTGVRLVLFKEHLVDIILRENPVPVRATADVSLFLRYSFAIPDTIL